MTEAKIVYDLMMEAEAFALSDDARFDEYDFVKYLFQEKRARTIRDTYRRNGTIYFDVVQNLYDYNTTKVNGADNYGLTLDLELGKVTIPKTISFHDDTEEYAKAIRRVSFKNKSQRIYPTSLNKFMQIAELGGDRLKLFSYYFIVGNELFVYPYTDKIDLMAVLENPLDGFVNDTEYKTSLVVNTSYTVEVGSITSNSIIHQVGDVFTATVTTFTGNGKVRLTTTKRAMTKNDPYPFNAAMLKQVKAELYNGEFRIQQISKPDVRNDSADNEAQTVQG